MNNTVCELVESEFLNSAFCFQGSSVFYQSFLFMSSNIYCMDMPPFVCHSLAYRKMSFAPFMDTLKNVTMNILV